MCSGKAPGSDGIKLTLRVWIRENKNLYSILSKKKDYVLTFVDLFSFYSPLYLPKLLCPYFLLWLQYDFSSNHNFVSLLQIAWSEVGKAEMNLLERSMRYNHFPAIFKIVEVILLLKLNRDQRTAKGWRFISLLSCLGKGLERLDAKKMAHIALEKQVIPQNLFKALQGRSANGYVAYVVHNVEHTLNQHQNAVLVTLTFRAISKPY